MIFEKFFQFRVVCELVGYVFCLRELVYIFIACEQAQRFGVFIEVLLRFDFFAKDFQPFFFFFGDVKNIFSVKTINRETCNHRQEIFIEDDAFAFHMIFQYQVAEMRQKKFKTQVTYCDAFQPERQIT